MTHANKFSDVLNKNSLLTFILLLLIVVPVFAETSATIRGTVLDSTSTALPGVTVYLKKGDDTPSITYTDSEGKFYFPNLTNGSYEVSAELEGFQTITSTISLQDSTAAPIEITLPSVENVQETVTVNAEAEENELLKKQETEHNEELDGEVFSRVPVSTERFQDALPLIPTVVRGVDGLMNINGARATESALLVNGSNVTDPVTGNYAIELPIEAVENVEVLTNPYSAEYGKFTAGLTSVSTKPGGDRLKVELNDFMPRFHFDNGVKGLESFTPRFRVSGPTYFKNLYFSQAVQYKLNRTYLEDLPKGANMIQAEGFDSITQLDYRPSTTHQTALTLSVFPQKETNAKLNTFLPEESTPNFKQRGYNVALADRRFFQNGSFLENIVSFKTYNVDVLPKRDEMEPFDITIEGYRNNYFNTQERDSSRVQLSSAYSFRPWDFHGSHAFRTGADVAHTSYSGTVEYSPVEVLGQDNRLLERDDFSGAANIGHSSNEISSYFEDHWTVSSELTVDSGVRVDLNSISGRANLGPRLSVAYAPAKLPKTVFKSGIGVFYDKIFLNAADFEKYPSRIISEYDGQGNVTSTRELVNRIDGDIKAPRSVAWNLEVDQQVHSKLLLRSNFSLRHGDDQIIVTPTNNELLMSNGGRSRYWDWEFTTKYQMSNDTNLFASYVRSSTKGNLNDFDTYFGNFQRALIREDAYAPLAFDVPNRFLFWGVVKAPGKVYVSPLLEIRNGFPYSVINQAQQYVGARNSKRYPSFQSLDLRVTRTFTVLSKYQLTVGMKVFNVLNHFNPRDVQNNLDSPAFGTFYNSVGRTYRAAFEIQY